MRGEEYLLQLLASIPAEKLREYIEKDRSLRDELDSYLRGNPAISSMLIAYLRLNWGRLESTLTNVQGLLAEILARRPDFADVLDTPRGREWLNRQARELYDYLYNLVWGRSGE